MIDDIANDLWLSENFANIEDIIVQMTPNLVVTMTITSIKKINMIIYFNILTIRLDYIFIMFLTCMSIFMSIECCLLFYP